MQNQAKPRIRTLLQLSKQRRAQCVPQRSRTNPVVLYTKPKTDIGQQWHSEYYQVGVTRQCTNEAHRAALAAVRKYLLPNIYAQLASVA